jgi:L,D-transpeptidase catalytic domain
MRLIRNALALLPALLLMANTHSPLTGNSNKINIILPAAAIPATVNYYAQWNLTAAGLSEDAFKSALKGYNYLVQKKLLHNTSVLTVVDYSKPSSAKRLYVLDMNSGKILFKTFVAHGKNSGLEYASSFSNEEESYKTSLGFFITNNTYNGSNGYSLKLQGCEKGINDKAAERAIVMHGAAYANEDFLQSNGYLGRSYGCPAVPEKMSKQIIDVIKNGSCLFLYHPTKKYINSSKILSS